MNTTKQTAETGSVAKDRLKAEIALTIFSETFDERFQVAAFSGFVNLLKSEEPSE